MYKIYKIQGKMKPDKITNTEEELQSQNIMI